jgi:predicted chitinase
MVKIKQAKVGNIEFSSVLSFQSQLALDGDSNRYSITVPIDDGVIKELSKMADATEGIFTGATIAPQPVPVAIPQLVTTDPTLTVPSGATVGGSAVTIASNEGSFLNTVEVERGKTAKSNTPVSEVERVQAIINECKKQGVTQIEQIAYILATAQHECSNLGRVNGKNGYFIPITEWGGTFRYDPFRGRGLVQLTWKYNYEKYEKLIGKPLVTDPTLVIRDFNVSVFILVHGHRTGNFTGKKLSDYVRPGSIDFVGARRVINGTDKADRIAGYARDWVSRLSRNQFSVSGSGGGGSTSLVTPPATTPTVTTSPTATAGTTSPTATAGTTPAPVEPTETTAIFTIEYENIAGQSEEVNGFLSSYEIDYSSGTISINGVGYRRKKDIGSQRTSIILEPFEPLDVLDDGATLLYLPDNRRTIALDFVLGVNQSNQEAAQLTVIKDKKVRGYPATVTIPDNVSILPGDKITCKYLYPTGEYTVDSVTMDGSVLQLSVYQPIEVNLPDPPPPPTVITTPTVTGDTTTSTGTTGTGTSGTVTTSTGGATGIRAKMVQVALSNQGKPSGSGYSPAATNNGRLACAWAVNEYVLKPTFGKTFGSNTLAVISVMTGLRNAGWKRTSSTPGAICSAVNAVGGHIGIIIGANDSSLSNSSSRASFSSIYPWQSQMSRTYSGAVFEYLVPPD